LKASNEQIAGAGAVMGDTQRLGRAAGVSKVSAPSLARAIQCDFELNVTSALRVEDGAAEKLVVERLAKVIPCHRTALGDNIVKWSERTGQVAEMLGFAQAGRIAATEDQPRAASLLLIETVDSKFGEKASGSASFQGRDGRERRLITPTLIGARKPIPVGIYSADTEDMDEAGFSKQIVEIARKLDRGARRIQTDQLFPSPSSHVPQEEGAPPPFHLEGLPLVFLVPATAVGPEIARANALTTLYADPAMLRRLSRSAGYEADAGRAGDVDAGPARGLFDRIVVEVDEPLRADVKFLSPTAVGNAIGWMVASPLFRRLQYKPDSMYYALEVSDSRTLMHRALGREAPEQMLTAGPRRTTFELIGFDFGDTARRARGPMLFEAIAHCEFMCQRKFVRTALEQFGKTFAPAWTEAIKETQRNWVHNVRLIEYLATTYPKPLF
jgi:hypothetical protein